MTLENIKMSIVPTQEDMKLNKLCELINNDRPYMAMVFCRTKDRADKLAEELARRGYAAGALHGDLSQQERTRVLREFRAAKLQILTATDIAARGLDIEGVTHVYNYDIPRDGETYIHRIGRTGRAGREGVSVTFVTAREYDRLRRIESVINEKIERQKKDKKPRRPASTKAAPPKSEKEKPKVKFFTKNAVKPLGKLKAAKKAKKLTKRLDKKRGKR